MDVANTEKARMKVMTKKCLVNDSLAHMCSRNNGIVRNSFILVFKTLKSKMTLDLRPFKLFLRVLNAKMNKILSRPKILFQAQATKKKQNS